MLKKSESIKDNMFTPEFSHASRKMSVKVSSPNDFELKRVVLGKENISSNQKKAGLKRNNDLNAYDIDFATSDESVAVKKLKTFRE